MYRSYSPCQFYVPNISTVNIALRSALATIVLTIPAVLAISFFTDRGTELELESVEIALLILTLLVCTVNLLTERTNSLI